MTLLFAYCKNRFSHDAAQISYAIILHPEMDTYRIDPKFSDR